MSYILSTPVLLVTSLIGLITTLYLVRPLVKSFPEWWIAPAIAFGGAVMGLCLPIAAAIFQKGRIPIPTIAGELFASLLTIGVIWFWLHYFPGIEIPPKKIAVPWLVSFSFGISIAFLFLQIFHA